MARRPRKRPKAAALPPARKHPRTAPGTDPALHDRETIVWAFGIVDLEGPWGWRTEAGRVWWSEILPKLQDFESMTWEEIMRAAGGRNIFDVAVEMRFYRRNIGADVIQLDVVYRHGDDDNDWLPFIDPDSGEIIVIPGTATNIMRELRHWLASSAGEGCPFPAARFAVYAMCERANPEERDAYDSSLRMEDGMPVVVGHSLGGAAAQFIATSRSPRESNGWPTCPGVNAYAFGSIGLTSSSVGTIRGTLKTYASDCDWLVSNRHSPFAGRVQTGHLFTLSSDSHLIDSIQRDLCACLRGDGNHVFHIHDLSEPPQGNRDLCEGRSRQG